MQIKNMPFLCLKREQIHGIQMSKVGSLASLHGSHSFYQSISLLQVCPLPLSAVDSVSCWARAVCIHRTSHKKRIVKLRGEMRDNK